MKVLLVDGPKVGQVVEVGNARDALMVPVFRSPAPAEVFDWGTFVADETFTQVVYTFTRCVVFDHQITVGSVNPEGPRPWDCFRLLTSDLAKAAVNF